MFEMWWEDGKAIFAFDVTTQESDILLTNYHREAEKGSGSSALVDLEARLQKISAKISKKITLVFPASGQKDTAQWLERNGYSYRAEDDAYLKQLS